ncbi:MAG: hypothetical protein ACOX9C_13115 [Kiritimatiellia bacterium]
MKKPHARLAKEKRGFVDGLASMAWPFALGKRGSGLAPASCAHSSAPRRGAPREVGRRRPGEPPTRPRPGAVRL